MRFQITPTYSHNLNKLIARIFWLCEVTAAGCPLNRRDGMCSRHIVSQLHECVYPIVDCKAFGKSPIKSLRDQMDDFNKSTF